MNELPERFSPVSVPAAAPAGHPAVGYGRIGVLLLNLGTPDATGYWPMRRYLKEFLSDRRVIEVNPARLVVRAQRDRADEAPLQLRRSLPADLEQGAR